MKLQLIITVDYGTSSITKEDATANLKSIGDIAAGEGLFTGDGPGEVETWESEVRELASARVRCQNCAWEGNEETCEEIKHVFERVAPGEPMPVGECPKCGALCHYVEPSAWDTDAQFPVSDWKYEVANDDTRLGYKEWVAAKRSQFHPAG